MSCPPKNAHSALVKMAHRGKNKSLKMIRMSRSRKMATNDKNESQSKMAKIGKNESQSQKYLKMVIVSQSSKNG